MANIISDETIDYVGILAKLELSPEEKEQAKTDMGRMLDYIDKLNELDTTGVEPMSHVFPVQNVFREDVVTNGDESEKILKNARKLDEVVIGFRPECCSVEEITNAPHISETMKVEVSEMLGDTLNIYGFLGKNHMVVRTNPFTKYTVNEDFKFYVSYDHIVLFDAKSENIINED